MQKNSTLRTMKGQRIRNMFSSIKYRVVKTLILLASVFIAQDAMSQCTAMFIGSSTPTWNGNEYCTGYDPSAINAPNASYIGVCLNTPSYNWQWQTNVNGGGWTTVSSGTGSAFVPGYNPPAITNTPAGTPIKTQQWRLIMTDVANGGLSSSLTGYIIFIGSQMTTSGVTAMTCSDPVNGSVNLTVNGGLTDKVFAWTASGGGVIPSGQEDDEDLSLLTAGTYQVVVSDGGCANQTATFVVSGANNLNASITSSSNVSCFGGSDGIALLQHQVVHRPVHPLIVMVGAQVVEVGQRLLV